MAANDEDTSKRRRLDVKMPTLQLLNGTTIPALGLGTFGGSDPPHIMAEAVRKALELGYRSFDCAECYGNELELGVEFSRFLASGASKREELFVASKVWNTNHSPEHVREACLNTLQNLQVKYLDLYLLHWPMAWEYVGKAPFSTSVPRDDQGRPKLARIALHRTWAAMEALVDEGKVKHIGISNFTALLLGDLLNYARIPPACNQVEMTPYLQQRNLLEMCRRNGVILAAYCPLGRRELLQETAVQRIATAHGTSPAAVVLAWAVTRGTLVLPKSSNAERLAENLSACELQLRLDDMRDLDSLECGKRIDTFAAQNGCIFID